MTFKQFRELFYTTDDKANICIDVVYTNKLPSYPDGTYRIIDKELDKYNHYYVIGLIQLFDEIGVVLADRGDINACPVKIGRWITDNAKTYLPHTCSECGHAVILKYPYCENCGAKMDGGVHNG